MKVFLVENYRDESTVHNFATDSGVYFEAEQVKGTVKNRATAILLFAMQKRPEKIIVEKAGLGSAILDQMQLESELFGMTLESNGTVYYS